MFLFIILFPDFVWLYLQHWLVCAQFVVLNKVETETERIREVGGVKWTFNAWGGMFTTHVSVHTWVRLNDLYPSAWDMIQTSFKALWSNRSLNYVHGLIEWQSWNVCYGIWQLCSEIWEKYASAAGTLGGCYDDWAHDDLVARKVRFYIDSCLIHCFQKMIRITTCIFSFLVIWNVLICLFRETDSGIQ